MELNKLLKGCCGGEGTVNFSLLKMPELPYIDLTSYVLWGAALVLFVEPFFKPLFIIQKECFYMVNYHLGQNLAFFMYASLSYIYSFWAFLMFFNTISGQPRCPELYRNNVLLAGYCLFVAGILIKVYMYKTQGYISVMGGKNSQDALKPGSKRWSNLHYHPGGTTTVMCYMGCALIRASVAGILLSADLILAYLFAFRLEKYFFPEPKQENNLTISSSECCKSCSSFLQLMRSYIPLFKLQKVKTN